MTAFLKGQHIFLRELRPGDVTETSNYYRWMNDPAVTRYFEHSGFFPITVEQLIGRVNSVNQNPDVVSLAVMLDAAAPEHIGTVRIGPINWLHRFSEMMITIDRPHWGKGYATEAVTLMRDYAFDKLNLHKLTANAYAANEASVHLLQKIGFNIEGSYVKQFLLDGKYTDGVMLGMFNPKWHDPAE
jgi:[ribosomal protein S5]-alanine N-acetyltransferase